MSLLEHVGEIKFRETIDDDEKDLLSKEQDSVEKQKNDIYSEILDKAERLSNQRGVDLSFAINKILDDNPGLYKSYAQITKRRRERLKGSG